MTPGSCAFSYSEEHASYSETPALWLCACTLGSYVESDCTATPSSVRGISQARTTLEWAAISSSRGPSWVTDQTHVSCVSRKFLLPLSHQGSPSLWLAVIFLPRYMLYYMYFPAKNSYIYTHIYVYILSPISSEQLLWVASWVYMLVQLLIHVQLCTTPWTVAPQAPLPMGFPMKEHWSGLPAPPPGALLDSGRGSTSPALATREAAPGSSTVTPWLKLQPTALMLCVSFSWQTELALLVRNDLRAHILRLHCAT